MSSGVSSTNVGQVPSNFRLISCSNATTILCVGSIVLVFNAKTLRPQETKWIVMMVLGFYAVFWSQNQQALSTLPTSKVYVIIRKIMNDGLLMITLYIHHK